MSLQVFQSKLAVFGLALLMASTSLFANQSSDKQSELPGRDMSADRAVDRTYRRIIKRERKLRSSDRVVEDTVSGIAAVMIGLYGYYFDHRGLLAKIVYSATQTAGVYLISDATFRANQPSLVLEMESQWQKGEDVSYEDYRRMAVRNDDELEIAGYKKNAYAGGLLATIYLYSAVKEKEVKALSNIFYFLSFNFMLVSGAGFYKAFTYERTQIGEVNKRRPAPKLQSGLLPFPRVALLF